MAAESPFGSSFADPRKYMGQSGLGQAVKTGLTAYGMQKSGLTDWLNTLNKKPTQPIAPPQAVTAPVQPTSMSAVAPVMPTSMVDSQSPSAPVAMPQANMTPPPDVGMKLLDDAWDGMDVGTETQRDFNPLSPDSSNQAPMTGNEYQQMPGFGTLKKIASQFMGQ